MLTFKAPSVTLFLLTCALHSLTLEKEDHHRNKPSTTWAKGPVKRSAAPSVATWRKIGPSAA
jgi:hypothetical protein